MCRGGGGYYGCDGAKKKKKKLRDLLFITKNKICIILQLSQQGARSYDFASFDLLGIKQDNEDPFSVKSS